MAYIEYKIPENIKQLITYDFLKEFRNQLFRIHHYWSIDTFAEKIQNNIQQTIANTVYITIERQGDTFFVYDSKTSKFLTQSSDRKELAENLKKMFPNKRLAAKQENIREVGLDESL